MRVTVSPAEQRARAFVARFEHLDPERFTVEVRVDGPDEGIKYDSGEWMLLPQVSVVATIKDRLTGGFVWGQWITWVGQPGKPGSTAFLGGRYRFTMLGKERRIRKSIPHLSSVAYIVAM